MAQLILYKTKGYDTTYLTSCIIKFCEHAPDQAEQCATIVNGKGNYVVKSADLYTIEEIAFLFENVGLVTKIVDNGTDW